jgi:hypothetical protein
LPVTGPDAVFKGQLQVGKPDAFARLLCWCAFKTTQPCALNFTQVF